MAFTVGGRPLAVELGQGVMEFNKEGRDGFPFKASAAS